MTKPADAPLRIWLSAVGRRPTRVAVHSRQLGVRILSVPGCDAMPSAQCVLETSLADDELIIASLSWRRLELVAEGPSSPHGVLMAGRARAMRLFHDATGTGIRTSSFRPRLPRAVTGQAPVVG